MSPYIEIENEYGTFRMKHEEFSAAYASFARETGWHPSNVEYCVLDFLESFGKEALDVCDKHKNPDCMECFYTTSAEMPL